jgi:hypothetical protein
MAARQKHENHAMLRILSESGILCNLPPPSRSFSFAKGHGFIRAAKQRLPKLSALAPEASVAARAIFPLTFSEIMIG